MADIQVVASNGRAIKAPVEVWVIAILNALPVGSLQKVIEKCDNLLTERALGRKVLSGDGIGVSIIGNGH